jgi:hypothetical protein
MVLETLVHLAWRLYLAIPLMAWRRRRVGGKTGMGGPPPCLARRLCTAHSLDGGLPNFHSRAGALWYCRSLGLASPLAARAVTHDRGGGDPGNVPHALRTAAWGTPGAWQVVRSGRVRCAAAPRWYTRLFSTGVCTSSTSRAPSDQVPDDGRADESITVFVRLKCLTSAEIARGRKNAVAMLVRDSAQRFHNRRPVPSVVNSAAEKKVPALRSFSFRASTNSSCLSH